MFDTRECGQTENGVYCALDDGALDDGAPDDGALAHTCAPHTVRRPSPVQLLDWVFDDAVSHQTTVNREAARQMFAVHEAFELAREYPRVYVPMGAGDHSVGVEELDFAVRSVAFDLALRLHLSENLVRAFDHQAGVLRSSLPRLCELFLAGRISAQHVRAAVDHADGMESAELMAAFDERLSLVAEGLRAGEFARRCRLVGQRLSAQTVQERHDREYERRRVAIEPAEDGMGWLNLYAPVTKLAAIEAALSGTATRMRLQPGETRTKEQLKADILTEWAAGHHDARDHTSGPGPVAACSAQPVLLIDADGRFAELLGYGPVDPRSAAATLREASAFYRVVNDPVAPANLNLDRRSYRPNAAQRRWLKIRYGLSDAAGPYLAPDAEIDHAVEYQHGGLTNVANLLPMKKRLHRLKTVTKIRIEPRSDGTVRIRTPTGYDSDPPPF